MFGWGYVHFSFVTRNLIAHINVWLRSFPPGMFYNSFLFLYWSASKIWKRPLIVKIIKFFNRLITVGDDVALEFFLLLWRIESLFGNITRWLAIVFTDLVGIIWSCFEHCQLWCFFPKLFMNGLNLVLKNDTCIGERRYSFVFSLLSKIILHKTISLNAVKIRTSKNCILSSNFNFLSCCRLYLKSLLLPARLHFLSLIIHYCLFDKKVVRNYFRLAAFSHLHAVSSVWCDRSIRVFIFYKRCRGADMSSVLILLLLILASLVLHKLFQYLNTTFLNIKRFLICLSWVYVAWVKLLPSAISILLLFLNAFLCIFRICEAKDRGLRLVRL